MMKKLGLIMMAMLLLVLSACGSSGSSDSSKKKTIVMGTSADYPPFESVDTANGNKIVGFDLDLAKAVAKELGYKLEVKNQDFNGLIAALGSKKVDFVMAGMVDTPKRRQQVDFSKTYYQSFQVILTKKGTNIKSMEDLKNKKVGVQLGTTQETLAKKVSKTIPMNIQTWDKLNEMVEAMRAGKLDAIVTVDTVAYGYTSKDKSLQQFKAVVDGKTQYDPISAAFPKNSKLASKFDKALKKLEENGTKDKLVTKWIKNQ
ncbi:transporter substrate-binding domain-containing protein [Sporolactobacillus shoreicorticis]|uniref:Transporter substrate-binding domain-containing protein n=1 Tax=Sporolactobacillus shoreicorticis TaxID=1923877 RepID=A0ABW5S6F3_9BACL|nr:transporter substrate-binding domain-containing protein [Sporolactobacillus shoreicorticis]MCO7128140.1 transporter substrate-binding domain-containing protein [Sporolactobacillus shoreicorticis]